MQSLFEGGFPAATDSGERLSRLGYNQASPSGGFKRLIVKQRYRRFQLKFEPPFCFELSLRTLGWRGMDGVEWVRRARYRKLLEVEGRLVLVEVQSWAGCPCHRLAGRVLHPEQGIGRANLGRVGRILRRILFLDLDLGRFERFARRRLPALDRRRIRPAKGLRPVGHPSLYETLVWGIAGQQVNTRFALELKRRLAQQFGSHLEWQGERYLAFPSAERMSQVQPGELRALQFSQRKAEYVIDLARQFASGELSEERLAALGDDEIHSRLVAIRGIGEATAALAMIVGLGRFSRVPLGDLGLQKALQELHRLQGRPSPKEVAPLVEAWKPWGGLITYYLWFGTNRTQE